MTRIGGSKVMWGEVLACPTRDLPQVNGPHFNRLRHLGSVDSIVGVVLDSDGRAIEVLFFVRVGLGQFKARTGEFGRDCYSSDWSRNAVEHLLRIHLVRLIKKS